jgi:hypothetical protein
MAGHRGTETTFELTTIERLEQQDYKHLLGLELDRPHDEVVQKNLLRANLIERYRELQPRRRGYHPPQQDIPSTPDEGL